MNFKAPSKPKPACERIILFELNPDTRECWKAGGDPSEDAPISCCLGILAPCSPFQRHTFNSSLFLRPQRKASGTEESSLWFGGLRRVLILSGSPGTEAVMDSGEPLEGSVLPEEKAISDPTRSYLAAEASLL